MDAERVSEIFSELYPLAEEIGGAIELNGGAFALLARKIAAAGKPVAEMTLREFAGMVEQAAVEYNRLYEARK
ncbi:MAG: hypothetical protein WCY68_14495 [Desulfuromonadales bacterium]